MTANLTTEVIGNATPGDVRSTKTFSGVNVTPGASGSLVTQSNPGTITPGTAAKNFGSGIYDSAFSVAGDPNLVAGNIASGVSIFGVTGSSVVAAGNAVPGDVRSGKTFTSGASGSTQTGTWAPPQTASGTATSAATGQNFTTTSGGTASLYPITVSGLTFTPDTILLYVQNGDPSYANICIYKNGANFEGTGPAPIMVQESSQYLFKLTAPASVTSTGFTLPVLAASKSYNWVAWG